MVLGGFRGREIWRLQQFRFRAIGPGVPVPRHSGESSGASKQGSVDHPTRFPAADGHSVYPSCPTSGHRLGPRLLGQEQPIFTYLTARASGFRQGPRLFDPATSRKGGGMENPIKASPNLVAAYRSLFV